MPQTHPAPSARAVFLSYAREDSVAARRVADALNAFGVEAWFDQSELRGGDAWDQTIKRRIRECALFMPLVSATTQARGEGYFRREWKLAVERTHDMAAGLAFIVPVVIDDTPESAALVPDEFMKYQWTRLPHGVPSPDFVAQVKKLLEAPRAPASGRDAPLVFSQTGSFPRASGGGKGWIAGTAVALVVAAAAILLLKKPEAPATVPAVAPTPVPTAAPVVPAVDPKSIAVLPFANFSTDKDNEFFADGLQDEVITALAKVHGLKVISRTSVLAYKNPDGRNMRKIGSELGVATILEGSVQRMGSKVHLNVQLIDARTDDHVWANSYTEELTDVFSIETALAQEVVGAMKTNLTSDEKALLERRPTQNAEAYDIYLRACVSENNMNPIPDTAEVEAVIAMYDLASAKDPSFLQPHVKASMLHGGLYWIGSLDPTPARKAKAKAEVEAARKISPDAPETHMAQGYYDYTCLNDWNAALEEYGLAAAALPNDAELIFRTALAYRRLGRYSEAIATFERSLALDPKDKDTAESLAETIFGMHRYKEVVSLMEEYLSHYPSDFRVLTLISAARYELDGDRTAYLRGMADAVATFKNPSSKITQKAALDVEKGDIEAAYKSLEQHPEVATILNAEGTISYPVGLFRARLAWLLGRPGDASRFAGEAIEAFKRGSWTSRQTEWVAMGIADAEALSGRPDDAVRDGKAALDAARVRDVYSALDLEYSYGKLLVTCGRREEALAVLKHLAGGFLDIVSPNTFRYDPTWSKLKDDPRFEEYLRSMKPL